MFFKGNLTPLKASQSHRPTTDPTQPRGENPAGSGALRQNVPDNAEEERKQAEEKFKAAAEAYEILSDKQKKDKQAAGSDPLGKGGIFGFGWQF